MKAIAQKIREKENEENVLAAQLLMPRIEECISTAAEHGGFNCMINYKEEKFEIISEVMNILRQSGYRTRVFPQAQVLEVRWG